VSIASLDTLLAHIVAASPNVLLFGAKDLKQTFLGNILSPV
jgi:hypothetical protein